MATPWQQVLAQVESLNNPQSPFSYTVQDDRIVGFWDIAKIETLGFGGAATFDKEYRIDVRPVDEDRFDYTEQGEQRSSEVGLDGGGFSIGGFKGKSKSISFGTMAGTAQTEPDDPATWQFSTDRIKDPLFGFLEQHGWQPKGFFGKIFG